MRTIAIVNQKGGCGKTTTAINVAGMFAARGARTLLVDMDPQSHCAAGLAIPEKRIDLDVGDAMLAQDVRQVDTARLIWRTSRNLDLIPSRMKLAGLEAGRGGLADRADRHSRLRELLASLEDRYDICFIDGSPAIGLLTYNALVAADEVLVPVDTSFFSLQGATKQVNTIRTIGRRLETNLAYWIVATIHDPDSALAKDLLEELRRRFPKRVAPAVIRRDQSLKEAASFGQPVAEYAPRSIGAADYAALADWISQVPAPPRRGAIDEQHQTGGTPEAPSVEDVEIRIAPDAAESMARKLGVIVDAPRSEQSPVMEGRGTPAMSGSLSDASRAHDLSRLARQVRLARALRPAASSEAAHLTAEPAPKADDEVAGMIQVRPLPEAPAPLFGPRVEGRRVTLAQPLFLGRRVGVAGNFNAWSADSHPMRRDEARGIFEITLELPPGRHAYRLVIDGRWTADPFNSRFELNPFGEPNSVIEVT